MSGDLNVCIGRDRSNALTVLTQFSRNNKEMTVVAWKSWWGKCIAHGLSNNDDTSTYIAVRWSLFLSGSFFLKIKVVGESVSIQNSNTQTPLSKIRSLFIRLVLFYLDPYSVCSPSKMDKPLLSTLPQCNSTINFLEIETFSAKPCLFSPTDGTVRTEILKLPSLKLCW